MNHLDAILSFWCWRHCPATGKSSINMSVCAKYGKHQISRLGAAALWRFWAKQEDSYLLGNCSGSKTAQGAGHCDHEFDSPSLQCVCVSVMERHTVHGCYSPFRCCDEIPGEISFQGEDCINWADGPKAFSPWLAEGLARSSRHSRASWQVTRGGQLLASWQRKVMRYRVRVRTRCLPKDLPSLPESYLLHGADF